MTSLPALEVEDLHTIIRRRKDLVHAVDGVSFSVAPGETLGIVGESGSGKSMTGLSIMRLLPQSGHVRKGRIVLGGTDLLTVPPRAMAKIRGNRVAMVFQDPLTSLNPTMTVGAQVAETVRLHRKVSRSDAWARAVEIIDLVGIPRSADRSHDFPHQFSGGMRQRVAIAMALVCDPDVLIVDEPTTALDVTTQQQILDMFDDLRARFNTAVIFITHDLHVIAGRADKVVVMYAGKIVEGASAADLFRWPRHRYTEALLGAAPSGTKKADRVLQDIKGLPPDLSGRLVGCRFAPRCGHATDRCRDEEPPVESEESGHTFSCFHPSRLARPAEDLPPSPGEASAATTTGEPIFACEGIVKEFSTARGLLLRRGSGTISAVDNVSFSLVEGETFGLVGESGCGKSTLARVLVALDRPTRGEVRLRGVRLSSLGRRAMHVMRPSLQLVFQDAAAALNPRMTVEAIISEPLRIQRMYRRAERREVVGRLLNDVGLPRQAAGRYPNEFSGGERQRIALARALALAPSVIVADEPVSALDVSVQAQVLNLMARLQVEHQLTYVLVSHDLSVVRYLADRIGVMYLGKLVEVGTCDEVYLRPLHHYTQGLIDAASDETDAESRRAGVRGEMPSASNPPSGCRFRTRCPRAEALCADVEPELGTPRDDEHMVACHFPLSH